MILKVEIDSLRRILPFQRVGLLVFAIEEQRPIIVVSECVILVFDKLLHVLMLLPNTLVFLN